MHVFLKGTVWPGSLYPGLVGEWEFALFVGEYAKGGKRMSMNVGLSIPGRGGNSSLWSMVLVASSLLAAAAQAKYGGGEGTAQEPYLIYTAEQMNTIGLHREDWDKHFKLMADIDLSCL